MKPYQRALTCLGIGASVFALGACEPAGGAESATTPAKSATTPAKSTTTPAETPTPRSCLNAMDLIEEGFGYSQEGLQAMSAGLDAASRFDIDGVRASQMEMETSNADINELAPQLIAATSECRREDSAPTECVVALDLAGEGFEIAGEIFRAGGRSFNAAARGDTNAIRAEGAEIDRLAGEIGEVGLEFAPAKAECRGAS